MIKLPTTPGSIITFTSDFEGDSIHYVATLIPGYVSATGEIHEAVWSSSSLQGLDDTLNIFSATFLEEQAFTVLVETVRLAPEQPFGAREVTDLAPGTVIRYRDLNDGGDQVVVFAPGYIDAAEASGPGDEGFGEVFWINSYGGYFNPSHTHSYELVSILYIPKPA